MSLLKIIEKYDYQQRTYIAELEAKVGQLVAKNAELVNQLVSYVDTVDGMKLELIMGGALRKPEVEQ